MVGGLIPGVRLHASSATFSNGYSLSYEPDTPRPADGLDIWPATNPTTATVQLSTLEAPSGVGKSTLAANVYALVSGIDPELSVSFSPPIKPRRLAAGMVPQRASAALHWPAWSLLPKQSDFAKCFFSPEDIARKIGGQRLSQFSGGQTARLLVCSAIEHLSALRQPVSYLILDESFDGIDAQSANKILHALVAQWSVIGTQRHLFVLLVSHLDMNVMGSGLAVRRIALAQGPTREFHDPSGDITDTPITVRHV